MGSSVSIRTLSSAWKFTLVGIGASIPVTIVLNWLPDQISQADFGATILVFGALIAGFVAKVYSSDPGTAGLLTGFIGAVVGISTSTVVAGESITSSLSTIVFFFFATGLLIVVASLFGLFFGRIGGWFANTVEPQWRTSTEMS